MKNNRFISFLVITLTYILAGVLGYFLFPIIKLENLMVRFLIIDLICTVFVYLVGMIFKNASVYDPYWSVAPMVILPLFMVELEAYNIIVYIIIALYFIWGIRLTANWAYGFKNLNHQDWRYQMLKEKHPKLWFIINLLGVHIVPTVVVFIGMLPTMYLISNVAYAEFSVASIFSIIIIIVAIILETVADIQMHKFRKNPENVGKINETGVWKVARHPNYGGEILFWLGTFLYTVSMDFAEYAFILAFSPLFVFLLFVFVSVPMMEKRQKKNKQGYEEYIKRTNLFLPIFPKK